MCVRDWAFLARPKMKVEVEEKAPLWSVRDWVFFTSNTKGSVECVWPGLLIWTWSFPFFYRNMHAVIIYRNMHNARCNMHAVSILRCKIDSFLLNKKGLESMSILHKNFCNMHIARRNMHIAIESILPLTHTPYTFSVEIFLLFSVLCHIIVCICVCFMSHQSRFLSFLREAEVCRTRTHAGCYGTSLKPFLGPAF